MLSRFSIAVEEDLLSRFDSLSREEGYTNRSEAIRDLIRDALVRREWESDTSVTVGLIILVYDHHTHGLMEKLTDIQHHTHTLVVSSMHTHLDEKNCLEIIITRGIARDIRDLAGKLISIRGVKHGRLVGSTSGKNI